MGDGWEADCGTVCVEKEREQGNVEDEGAAAKSG
jgi:hypothetical protein